MTDTSQHYNPLGKSDYLSIQHLERYRFAISRLQPRQRLLDIACGAGYGTAILLKHDCNVIGADYDEQAISAAQTKYRHGNFVIADALHVPFKDESFDAVVSFETIEHVHDGHNFLSEVFRVLKPGGTFIGSTPNILYTAHPPYHVKEYGPEEFYRLVQDWFSQVERYGQYFKLRDRTSDLYRRQFHVLFGAFLEMIGAREKIKRLFQPVINVDAKGSDLQRIEDIRIGQALKENCDSYYRVRPFINTKWLRIMVVVAKKETD